MFKSALLSALTMLMLAKTAFAENCATHTFGSCDDGIVHWYDPDTGEICDPFDCGGGRAPPKTNVPGCPLYTGTETRATSPSYLPCWAPSTSSATPVTTESSETTANTVTVGTSTTPLSTPPTTESAQSSGKGIRSTSSTSAPPTQTPNAGGFMSASLMAVAGAAIGAVALV